MRITLAGHGPDRRRQELCRGAVPVHVEPQVFGIFASRA